MNGRVVDSGSQGAFYFILLMLAWISVLYSEELSCLNILSQLRGCIEWLGSVRLIERPTAAYGRVETS